MDWNTCSTCGLRYLPERSSPGCPQCSSLAPVPAAPARPVPAWRARERSAASFFAGLMLLAFALVIANVPLRSVSSAHAIRAAIVVFEVLLGASLVYGSRVARPVGAAWAIVVIAFFLFGAQGGAVPFVVYFLGVFVLLATPPAGASTALFLLLALPMFLYRLWLGLAVASAVGGWTHFWHVFLHGSG